LTEYNLPDWALAERRTLREDLEYCKANADRVAAKLNRAEASIKRLADILRDYRSDHLDRGCSDETTFSRGSRAKDHRCHICKSIDELAAVRA
jgi:hypothetical protein